MRSCFTRMGMLASNEGRMNSLAKPLATKVMNRWQTSNAKLN